MNGLADKNIKDEQVFRDNRMVDVEQKTIVQEQKKVSARVTLTASCFALIAFAANSVLCRLALGESSIDPASFIVLRMLSGAITLTVIVLLFPQARKLSIQNVFSIRDSRGWFGSIMLFVYAIFFSYAYLKLDTASGALILFATVQLSMIGVSFLKGNRLPFKEWLGIIISFSGFVLLMLPGATQPSLTGFVLMLVAGIAWAFYTLEGKTSKYPVLNTAENFIRCIPFALILLAITFLMSDFSWQGILYAIASGSIASGMGYAVWYMALRNLSITQAAISQLSVPLIAAVGGVIFVDETLTTDLMLSGILILGGIAIVSLKEIKRK